MSVIQALILGIAQGITELLPISSSAHLTLIPWFFKWDTVESFNISFEAFDVALHAGTLLAIALFFFKDWINLLKGAYKQTIKKEKNPEGKMFWYIVLATIPGGIIGFVLDKFCENVLSNILIIATALIIMGIILYIADKKGKNETDYENLSLKQTFLVGLSQSLAFIPGVSRSGITMTTARLMGVKREAAARYSFMLSAPIVLAATLYKFKDFAFTELTFWLGVFVSFLVGIFVIKFLLDYLKKGSFKGFAIYRVVIGIIVLVTLFLR